MATKRKSRKSRKPCPAVLGKPNGVIQPRVQAVGPERFGVVAVDCAKARSKWMLCDFYGNILIPPTDVEHHRAGLQMATVMLKEACRKHGLQDHIVAVEMTGTYHKPVQRAFREAGQDGTDHAAGTGTGRNPRENALHLALEPARNQRGQRPETVSPFQSTGSSVRAG